MLERCGLVDKPGDTERDELGRQRRIDIGRQHMMRRPLIARSHLPDNFRGRRGSGSRRSVKEQVDGVGDGSIARLPARTKTRPAKPA